MLILLRLGLQQASHMSTRSQSSHLRFLGLLAPPRPCLDWDLPWILICRSCQRLAFSCSLESDKLAFHSILAKANISRLKTSEIFAPIPSINSLKVNNFVNSSARNFFYISGITVSLQLIVPGSIVPTNFCLRHLDTAGIEPRPPA